jgi:hypothetical protein
VEELANSDWYVNKLIANSSVYRPALCCLFQLRVVAPFCPPVCSYTHSRKTFGLLFHVTPHMSYSYSVTVWLRRGGTVCTPGGTGMGLLISLRRGSAAYAAHTSIIVVYHISVISVATYSLFTKAVACKCVDFLCRLNIYATFSEPLMLNISKHCFCR